MPLDDLESKLGTHFTKVRQFFFLFSWFQYVPSNATTIPVREITLWTMGTRVFTCMVTERKGNTLRTVETTVICCFCKI